MIYKELLLGCGESRKKKLVLHGTPAEWQHLTTLDINPDANPDVLWDLNLVPYPFQNDEFDEIHAYEVLEHFGKQGDYLGFFNQFEELYRILKPKGYLLATVPRWDRIWAWGDPGHTRILNEGTLMFLNQENYGKPPMTDYRSVYKGNLKTVLTKQTEQHLVFALQKV